MVSEPSRPSLSLASKSLSSLLDDPEPKPVDPNPLELKPPFLPPPDLMSSEETPTYFSLFCFACAQEGIRREAGIWIIAGR